MANLKSLIRLRKYTVDERQKILAGLYNQANLLESRRDSLQKSLEEERQALSADASPEMISYFGNFSQVVREDIERIDEELERLEAKIHEAREKVREAFADMKRIEIVAKARQEEERKELDAKEERELNEIGIEGFRRKEG